MAKAIAKPKKEISMEEALWKSADKLRGSVEPAEYKHVVLSLFFLKFASDKFEAQLLLITNVVPLLLGTFAETCSLNLPQKGRKAGHDCLWAVA